MNKAQEILKIFNEDSNNIQQIKSYQKQYKSLRDRKTKITNNIHKLSSQDKDFSELTKEYEELDTELDNINKQYCNQFSDFKVGDKISYTKNNDVKTGVIKMVWCDFNVISFKKAKNNPKGIWDTGLRYLVKNNYSTIYDSDIIREK